jgi:hypothetical protein
MSLLLLYLKVLSIPCGTSIYTISIYTITCQSCTLITSQQAISFRALGQGFCQIDGSRIWPVLVHTADVEDDQDIFWDHRSIMPSVHLINGVAIAWTFKKQSVTTLHSTGSEIASLTSGVKKKSPR